MASAIFQANMCRSETYQKAAETTVLGSDSVGAEGLGTKWVFHDWNRKIQISVVLVS
jgi:hypothetical protein